MQTAAAPSEKKKQILVVEDEGLIAMDLQRQLQRLGYDVPVVANSGEQAIQFARSTVFDLVLMDIHLQGTMDGIRAAEILRNEFQTPVVYTTAHSDPETLRRAKLTGPLGYLLKPIAIDNLRSTLEVSLYKHEMEHLLLVSEAWHWTTLRSIGEGIIATDTSGELVFLNPVAEELTGWSRMEVTGRPVTEVVTLLDESTGKPIARSALTVGGDENGTCTLVSRTGTKTPVEVACYENRTSDEVLGTIIIVRDITARRKWEARVTQSQRMEAIAAMAGGLAHDFSSLLTIIHGYADELARNAAITDQEPVRQIQQATSMATRINRQLLMLSRRQSAQPEIMDLNKAVCEIQPLLSFSLGKTVTVSTNLGATDVFIWADPNQIKQALVNLALNAKDAMPTGGDFSIESSVIDIEPGCPAASQHRPGRYVYLQVADTGAGMKETTLEHVFEPFFTTKEPGAGTGLGLSIVHSTVVQSGGYISVESQPGAGTTFEILLPCLETVQNLARNLAESHPEAATAAVLIVEDDGHILDMVRHQLAGTGYRLLEASGVRKAEQIAEFYMEPIDLLVTDITLPGTSGIELAERLHLLRPEMKTLFFFRSTSRLSEAAA